MHNTATWSNRISEMLRDRYRVGGDTLALASHPAASQCRHRCTGVDACIL